MSKKNPTLERRVNDSVVPAEAGRKPVDRAAPAEIPADTHGKHRSRTGSPEVHASVVSRRGSTS